MICSSCGNESPSYSVRLTPRGRRIVCRNCTRPHPRSRCHNPYSSLTLDHVHDAHGQPLHVTSLRQMQEAEKKYRFKSLVANECEADFDKPPQTRVGDMFEQTTEAGGWLYPEIAEQQVREMRESGEIGPAR